MIENLLWVYRAQRHARKTIALLNHCHVGAELLAFEPRVFGDGQFALFTSGEIRKLGATELEAVLPKEARP